MQALLVFALAIIATLVKGFKPTFNRASRLIDTKLFEDFNLGKTTVTSDKRIFSEKQLREFTAGYSVDERWNPFAALTGLLDKKPDSASTTPTVGSVEKFLKPTISLQILEEKTAAYVSGKASAAQFMAVLKAAFGPKLDSVFIEIVSKLPEGKAKALKAAKK